ncbi:hypothetical protein ACROYT_G023638 [Oculina patagonica]
MTGTLDVDLCRASFPRVMNVEGKDNYTSVLLVGFQCTQTRTKMMPWCKDRGPRKNGVSDVRRELNLSESVGEHKWICWSSTGANIITNAFSREGGEGSARNSCDVPVLGSISKDLNLTQSLKKGQALKEGQAFIDMESRQDSVSTDKHD